VSTTFKITDSTGEIEVNSWIDNEETEENVRKRAQWVTGAYVRVVGNCRLKPNSQPPVKSVMAFHIRKIDDFNELTYHLLDSVHAHLYNTQGPKDSLPPAGSNFASPGKPSMGPGSRAPAAGAGAAVAAFSNPAGVAGEPLPQDWRVQGAPSKMGSAVPLALPRLKLPRGPFCWSASVGVQGRRRAEAAFILQAFAFARGCQLLAPRLAHAVSLGTLKFYSL
jgi:hypothetical protein